MVRRWGKVQLSKLRWKWILRIIGQADDGLISLVSQALIRRFGVLHPDHELVVMALPKHSPQERAEIMKLLQ